ncbi:hypothetical protein EJD97_014218 [Solanum chilense]|uniref:Uncharacterized protein n=1 Tax=Solanum chilense TaxID=4083 RepID=A0A6N2BA62_SOLCI|nr:hypothetical protein EJD97_014218 [Solanum chilense]
MDSPYKSKNKRSKQKRDATKRRENRLQEKDSGQEQGGKEEACNKFIMVDDNHGLSIFPLQAQYMNTPTSSTPKTDPPDLRKQKGKLNSVVTLNEYVAENSEDDINGDNQSIKDDEDDDETSEALIRAFSPHKDQTLEEEIQQVSQSHCLSPRGLQYGKFHFQRQDANTITSGRPNTRLFISK